MIMSFCLVVYLDLMSAEILSLHDSTTSRHAHSATRKWMCTSMMHYSSLVHAASWMCTSTIHCCMCTSSERHAVLMHCLEQQGILYVHRASGRAHSRRAHSRRAHSRCTNHDSASHVHCLEQCILEYIGRLHVQYMCTEALHM